MTRNLLVENEAGVYFGGAATYASRDNRVIRNIVSESRRFAVHGSYKPGAPHGSATSCSTTASGARHGWAETASWPPATASSIHVWFRRAGSYRVAATSPCKHYRAGA